VRMLPHEVQLAQINGDEEMLSALHRMSESVRVDDVFYNGRTLVSVLAKNRLIASFTYAILFLAGNPGIDLAIRRCMSPTHFVSRDGPCVHNLLDVLIRFPTMNREFIDLLLHSNRVVISKKASQRLGLAG
jgi:hypothetical protein